MTILGVQKIVFP